MRLSPLVTITAALAALLVFGFAGARIIQPNRVLLTDAGISLSRITPNADGEEDVTTIRYTLNRNAKISIYFTPQGSSDGPRYLFRDQEARPADSYQVQFSGVVNAFPLADDKSDSQIEARLIPNGTYEWRIVAESDSESTVTNTGTLVVENADTQLPDISSFSISPEIFTPNQDGVDDRVSINIYLEKEATITAYLEDKDGKRYYVAEHIEGRKPGEPGAHVFDYDGGVDNNITPPPDGTYTVRISAEDKVGQRVSRTGTVTLKDGGLPNAEIVPQATGNTVSFTSTVFKDSYMTSGTTTGEKITAPEGVTSSKAKITLAQGDLLVFRLTISNYGATPIRTVGPFPGTVYSYNQTASAMSNDSKSGAWRVGLECENSETTLPWRWAIGAADQLTKVERNGETLYYLMPGQQTVVWGAIRMTELIKTRNPQECAASLIHEDVAIPPMQQHVGPIKVELTPAEIK